MTMVSRFRLAYLLTAVAAATAAYWIVELYPSWTSTGPAPGAGAQYVFILLPTAALACLASLAAVGLSIPVLARDSSARSAIRVTAAGTALVIALALCAFWIHVGIHGFAD